MAEQRGSPLSQTHLLVYRNQTQEKIVRRKVLWPEMGRWMDSSCKVGMEPQSLANVIDIRSCQSDLIFLAARERTLNRLNRPAKAPMAAQQALSSKAAPAGPALSLTAEAPR